MRSRFSYAVLALIAAIFAWVFVGFTVVKIGDDQAAETALAESLAQGSSQRDLSDRLHALVLSSEIDRGKLTSAIPADVTSIVDAITATGQAAHTQVQIGAASAAQLPDGTPASLHAVEFVVQADGTFSQVMQAASLFERMSVPSDVTELDFEQVPSQAAKATAPWRLTVRIRVLTTAAVTS